MGRGKPEAAGGAADEAARLAAELVSWVKSAAGRGTIGGVRGRGAARPPQAPSAGPAPAAKASAASTGDSLERIAAEVRACTLCRLSSSRRTAVPGEGPAHVGLMVIGEGPGAREDDTGRPFVGDAGAMLTRMLEAISEPRPTVFITNIVKCRPPGNRDPQPDEAAACRPYLERQIRLLAPLAILSLGRVSAQNLLGNATPISRLRGRSYRLGDAEVFPTFHPAYLLRNQADKKLAWQDLQSLKRRLDELRAAGGARGG